MCGGDRLDPRMRVAGEAGERGLAPATDRYGVALADVVECRACGHMQLDRMPSTSELAEAYRETNALDYLGEEPGQRATADRLLGELERWVAPGRLVDLGCWVGFLLLQAGERGWSCVGVEPSEFAAEYARVRHGLDVRTGGVLGVELDPGFDAVVMADVIEHLPDPGAALDRVASILAPGGVVALALPDAGSRVARLLGPRWWSVLPTHVQYFTRASLSRLLSRCGFEVVRVRTAPKTFTVRYYLDRIGGYSPTMSRALVGASSRLGLAEREWAPDFRDRMLIIARRP